ncbi:MAG TPA: type I-C CRISPR-associated protein Cas8c/Csd1 [Azospirillaceae bacterium]|nr:type I-C CRISPR-associated protein Cas8c/Csd1 [Azospirillaceae bacterium]
MSVLQALNRYYDRMAARGEAEAPGYSREKIGFAIVLSPDGAVVDVLDLRQPNGRKLLPRVLEVPAAVKRTVAILPNRLWDKSSYVLGRTAGDGRRTAAEQAAFKAANLELVGDDADPGLVAFRRFLEAWEPERFDAPPFNPEMLDANIVFRLDGELGFIHERPAARRLVERPSETTGATSLCLVTGTRAVPQRLHPTIKGVEGAQSSGAALVSFNLDAFTSYGKEQGANAPTSEAAAFRYGAALNRLLTRDGPNRLRRPIGDATVVFWADTSESVDEAAAAAAEEMVGLWLDPAPRADVDDDPGEAAKLRDALEAVAEGRAQTVHPKLMPGTRFHVLGLAPNAARLSVRYWLSDEFETFAARLRAHADDVAINPVPWRGPVPSIWRLLVKTTALQEKFENIPPLLAGELMRAVLGGGRYPRTLLTAAIIRLRAGDDPGTGWHAAAIRAVLARDHRLGFEKEPVPVSLDRENTNPAYQLGRMFAALETAQRLAIGKVNATIRDRYFGAASATPAGVFPVLIRNAQSHLGKLRKEGKGLWVEREIEEIANRLPPELPRSLRLEAQGRFAIGYYHQRKAQFAGRPEADEVDQEGNNRDVD